MKELVVIGIVVVSTVAGWIATAAVRRRMRRALGREVKDAELTSITTWMNVHETERKQTESEETRQSPGKMSGRDVRSGVNQIIQKARRVAEDTAEKVEDIGDVVEGAD